MATFGTATFFVDVELLVNANGRMYHGQEGDLHYVVIDPLFHPMRVFQRDPTRSFTQEAAHSLVSNDKVLINGQFFAKNKTDYCMMLPCYCQAIGETIVDGTKLSGNPPSAGTYTYFGKEPSRAAWRYRVGSGNPSGAQPPLVQALGGVVTLIEKHVSRGTKNVNAGAVAVQQNDKRVANFFTWGADMGKSMIAVHRTSGLILVVGQADGDDSSGGIGWRQLLDKLVIMGIDDATYLDGSSSAALWINGSFAHTPGSLYKDPSMPNGLLFSRAPLSLKSFAPPGGSSVASECLVTSGSTVLPASTQITGMVATIEPRTPAGLKLAISNFGHGGSLASAAIAAELSAGTAPFVFLSGAGNLSNQVTFTRLGGGPLTFKLKAQHTQGSDYDTLQGTFSTTSPSATQLAGTISLPIEY
jgi:hypothetical protein